MFKKLKKKLKTWGEYHNPFYPWYKARKKFPRPKCHFIYGKDIPQRDIIIKLIQICSPDDLRLVS